MSDTINRYDRYVMICNYKYIKERYRYYFTYITRGQWTVGTDIHEMYVI